MHSRTCTLVHAYLCEHLLCARAPIRRAGTVPYRYTEEEVLSEYRSGKKLFLGVRRGRIFEYDDDQEREQDVDKEESVAVRRARAGRAGRKGLEQWEREERGQCLRRLRSIFG
jgi:hypothetical protein